MRCLVGEPNFCLARVHTFSSSLFSKTLKVNFTVFLVDFLPSRGKFVMQDIRRIETKTSTLSLYSNNFVALSPVVETLDPSTAMALPIFLGHTYKPLIRLL